MKTITIQSMGGPKKVKAEIIGFFAVHPTLNNNLEFDKKTWTVSHIGMGHCIAHGLEKDKAMELAEGVQNKKWGIAWEGMTLEKWSELEARKKVRLRKFRKKILGVWAEF